MGEMATRSIQTLIDRLREICNKLIRVKKKKRSIFFDIRVEGECVYMGRGVQSLLNVRCGLRGLNGKSRAGLYHFTKRGQ